MMICKSKAELVTMREAERVVALTHQELGRHIQQGITTKDLDNIADKFNLSIGDVPSFKGYGGNTCSICTSVNQQLVHGIPGNRALQDGVLIEDGCEILTRTYCG